MNSGLPASLPPIMARRLTSEVREVPRRNWGYLPEERGLYPKMRMDEQLLFLARLNGLSKQAAEKELTEWLERFQISANRKKKGEHLTPIMSTGRNVPGQTTPHLASSINIL